MWAVNWQESTKLSFLHITLSNLLNNNNTIQTNAVFVTTKQLGVNGLRSKFNTNHIILRVYLPSGPATPPKNRLICMVKKSSKLSHITKNR